MVGLNNNLYQYLDFVLEEGLALLILPYWFCRPAFRFAFTVDSPWLVTRKIYPELVCGTQDEIHEFCCGDTYVVCVRGACVDSRVAGDMHGWLYLAIVVMDSFFIIISYLGRGYHYGAASWLLFGWSAPVPPLPPFWVAFLGR